MSQLDPPHVEGGSGSVRAAVSRAVVGLHARYYGRGPTRAQTHLGEDFVLCVLENVFTTAERTLIKAGRNEQVRATRAAFQDAMRDEASTAIEQITGRRVRAFLSQVHHDPEIATEVFILEPLGEDPDRVDG